MRPEEKEYTSSFDLKTWGRLLPFFRPYIPLFACILFLNILIALIDIALPLFQRFAVDHFILRGSIKDIWVFAGVYGLSLLVQSACVVLFTRGSIKVEMYLSRDMKLSCFRHLQTLSLSYYNTTPVGYILARVMNDTDRISALIAWHIVDMLWALTYVTGILVAMLALAPRLAFWILLIVPFMVCLTRYFQTRILHWNRRIRKQNSKIVSAYNEGIMGAKTSKTLVIENKNDREFYDVTGDMLRSGIRAARLNAVYISAIVLFGSIATAIVLKRGGDLVLADALQIGTLSAFTTYCVNLFEPIRQVARNLSELISAQANIERVMTLLDEKPQVTDRPDVIEAYGDVFHPMNEKFPRIRGDVVFDHVSFCYPDGKEPVLEDFSLSLKAGTTVAIVGETGAGKSTIVNLVCRFFEPTSGRILIDGEDYRNRSQLWLHQNIGYVLQSPQLFSGSILENIRYGRLDATDEEVMEAGRKVFVDRVADRLPNGWHTLVGEGGDALSTGEKQLISFARAILADPALFILDEATASIDTRTETLIQRAVDYALKDRTSFIIAHRLSTIRHADVILVVDNGRIVEQGSHEELLKKNGVYEKLYQNQFRQEL